MLVTLDTFQFARLRISFPELQHTDCPDTFTNVTTVPLPSKAVLARSGYQAKNPEAQFMTEMTADDELVQYVYVKCAQYNSTDLGGKQLQRCSKCGIARYCCKEHQREHWKTTHKKHCKRIVKLKESTYGDDFERK